MQHVYLLFRLSCNTWRCLMQPCHQCNMHICCSGLLATPENTSCKALCHVSNGYRLQVSNTESRACCLLPHRRMQSCGSSRVQLRRKVERLTTAKRLMLANRCGSQAQTSISHFTSHNATAFAGIAVFCTAMSAKHLTCSSDTQSRWHTLSTLLISALTSPFGMQWILGSQTS